MSIEILGRYLGNKKFKLVHTPSGSELLTDAPKDNQGEGRYFSPTDLLAASLGSCMTTIIANVADRHGVDISGTHFRVEKHMSDNPPRRIVRVPVEIHLPARLTSEQRGMLERAAASCPVHYSLREEIDAPILFVYDV